MVENKRQQEKISVGRRILSFIVTLILLPLLFLGTCFPFGLGAVYESTNESMWVIVLMVSLAVFLSSLIGAVKTNNQGIRWGIIVFWVLLVGSIGWVSIFR